MRVKLDGHLLSPHEGFLIRKGPGTQHYDFVQEIQFAPDEGNGDNFETFWSSLLPTVSVVAGRDAPI